MRLFLLLFYTKRQNRSGHELVPFLLETFKKGIIIIIITIITGEIKKNFGILGDDSDMNKMRIDPGWGSGVE